MKVTASIRQSSVSTQAFVVCSLIIKCHNGDLANVCSLISVDNQSLFPDNRYFTLISSVSISPFSFDLVVPLFVLTIDTQKHLRRVKGQGDIFMSVYLRVLSFQ